MTGTLLSVRTGKVTGSDPQPEPQTPEQALAAKRKTMICSPLQGILTLGEARWGAVLAYRDDPATPWAHKVIINSAQDWQRLSENMAFFGYLLNYDDEQMDDLFRAAMKVRV